MASIKTNGITMEYESTGDGEPLLLIMGLGGQLTDWPENVPELLASRGFRVIAVDNRDQGLSTEMDWTPPSQAKSVLGTVVGRPPKAGYLLSDMAADTAGLLDALGLDSAHVVGASMGGMIAQTLVIAHPERALSLTSVFSTTGEPEVGRPSDEAAAALITPAPTEREAYLEATAERWKIWSAPEHWDAAAVRARLEREYVRSFDPAAVTRQLAAILASGSRAEALPSVTAPTLVIHGLADTLVKPDGGRRTAELIPGAKLLEIPDMGHELPEAHWDTVLDAVEAHTGA